MGVGNCGEFMTPLRMIDRSGNRGESSRRMATEARSLNIFLLIFPRFLGNDDYFLTKYKPKVKDERSDIWC